MSTKISQLPLATSPVAPDVVLPVVQDGVTKKASIDQLGFLQSGTDATTRTIQNKLRDTVSVKDFGAVGDGTTDDTAAIQAAINSIYLDGGGVLHFPIGIYVVSSTIWIKQRVTLQGESNSFANQYGSNASAAVPRGSALFLDEGSNCDVVDIRCDIFNNSGVLTDVSLNTPNIECRHFGGLRDMIVWGNRSGVASPTVKDRNTTGHGINMRGARYPILDRVTSMFCADNGIHSTQYDYGTGLIFVNNIDSYGVVCLSNFGYGIYEHSGDSRWTSIYAGYNGKSGVFSISGNTQFIGGLSWNNVEDGFTSGPGAASSVHPVVGMHCYDNNLNGFRIVGSGPTNRAPSLLSCTARGNGRNLSASNANRANFHVEASAAFWHIGNCVSSAIDQESVATATYGYYINNTTYPGLFDANTSVDAIVADYQINDLTKASYHVNSNIRLMHPGFKSLGTIDMNNKSFENLASVRFSFWNDITTITSTTIDAGLYSLLSLSCSGPQTVNDITPGTGGLPLLVIRNNSADAVTFVNNSSKLRLVNAVNVVLAQYEAIMLVHISGTIWQQVGVS